MREIDNLSRAIARFVFQKETGNSEIDVIVDEQGNVSDSGLLYYRLKMMVKDGAINEAENLLFEEVESNISPENFEGD